MGMEQQVGAGLAGKPIGGALLVRGCRLSGERFDGRAENAGEQ
jgi:hypothetical protein